MSLVARTLEENGIPTLIIGSALDIVAHARVPRYLHVDFPLGNPCGKPDDRAMQGELTDLALDCLARASAENWLHRAPFRWSEDESWRDAYSRVDESNRETLLKRGEERRAQQAALRAAGAERSGMISET